MILHRSDGAGLTSLRADELVLRVQQDIGDIDAWLVVSEAEGGSLPLVISLESARRLDASLRAALADEEP